MSIGSVYEWRGIKTTEFERDDCKVSGISINSAALRIASLLFLSGLFASHSSEASRELLKRGDVQIVFEGEQGQAAREVADIYPSVQEEVTEALGLSADFGPTIVLDKGGSTIRAKANTGTDIYVGYAVPGKNLIALDTSRAYARPLTLRTVLKHELCHLILHSHLQNLPRWLDEGVCQTIHPRLLRGGRQYLLKCVSKWNYYSLSSAAMTQALAH